MCTHPFLGPRWALGVALIKSLSARHALLSPAGPLSSLLLLCSAAKLILGQSCVKRRWQSYLRRKERNCHTWPQHPLPIPLLWLWGRGGGIWKQGDMVSLSEWMRWERSFGFCLYCSLSKLIWIGEKLDWFSPSGTWFVSESDWSNLPVFVSIRNAFPSCFPHSLGKEEWAFGSQVRSMHQSPTGTWPEHVVPELLPCRYRHGDLSVQCWNSSMWPCAATWGKTPGIQQ